jgi:4-alpha-glucanotransferase
MVDWTDAWGRTQRVGRDELLAVIGALTGMDLDTEFNVAEAERELSEGRFDVEPVVVAWDGVLPAVHARRPISGATLVLEDGGEVPVSVREGVIRVERHLPIGYHRLVLDGGRAASHVFAAPSRAHPVPAPVLGLVTPVYSLRSEDVDTGVGTIRDLGSVGELCAECGVDVVGTLPLLASFPDVVSPYSPASRRAWNETLADLTALEGWSEPPPDPGSAMGGSTVDFEAAGATVRAHLRRYVAHVSGNPQLRDQVDTFVRAEPEIRRYASFRALTDSHGRDWRTWPGSILPDPERVAYHETVQWVMHTQLTRLSDALRGNDQCLYLDLPIGCHSDGYDVWDAPELFAPASLGAPPDTLFVEGQDWGLPAPIPMQARASGYADFRKAVRHQLGVAGLLRIDHVMALHRAWWVPHGMSAHEGAYVLQAADEMFAIACIESSLARSGVVGENLGTVPHEIRDRLAKHRIAGIVMASPDLTPPSPTDLVALSSHDTPTFVSWWDGEDIDDLVALGVLDEARAATDRDARAEAIDRLRRYFGTEGALETMEALHRWMAESGAAIALINLDDLLGEHRRQNVPGTYRERPNWRLRYDRTVEQLQGDTTLIHTLNELSDLRTR